MGVYGQQLIRGNTQMSKIREYIIILSTKQEKSLIEKAKANGYDDDLSYLQIKIDEILKDDNQNTTTK